MDNETKKTVCRRGAGNFFMDLKLYLEENLQQSSSQDKIEIRLKNKLNQKQLKRK